MRLFALGALTMIAFAANSVLNRMALAGDLIGPVSFGAVRVAAGALVLVALVVLRNRSGVPGPQGRLLPVAALLAYIFGFSAAYLRLDAGLGALVLFGMVQLTMFAGALRSEAIPPRRWAGAALAFAGLVVLLAPGDGSASLPHLALMILAGVGWGLYSLAGRGTSDALAASAANFLWAAPMALTAGAVALAFEPPPGFGGVALAIVSGAITSGLGYALWYSVLPALGATRGAVAQLTVPLIAALAGMVMLGEGLGLRFAVATMLVLGGVGLSLLGRAR